MRRPQCSPSTAPPNGRALLLAVAALLTVTSARASPELARAKVCLGCHAIEQKQVGPSFRAIAARYAGQQEAAGHLASKIMQGGSGAWGAVPMPANPKITPQDARTLALWVLSIR